MAEGSAQGDVNTRLQELIGSSASFGQWTLKISGPPIEKNYIWDEGWKTCKAFTVVFVSKDSSQYCMGRFTWRGAKPDAEKKFLEAKAKFQENIVWETHKRPIGET